MVSLIRALNFRSLKYVSQELGPFHVLVGPNASGKTTFLGTLGFLSRFVSDGLSPALEELSDNFQDILWQRRGRRFELAVETRISEERRRLLSENERYDTIRYELAVGYPPQQSDEIGIVSERVLLKQFQSVHLADRDLFPDTVLPPNSILTPKGGKNTRTVIIKVPDGYDKFYSEVDKKSGKGWIPTFKLGYRKSAFLNMPEDESKFPISTWLKTQLRAGVKRIALNSDLMRKPSAPGVRKGFEPAGANLPWIVEDLRRNHNQAFRNWLDHLRNALPDLEDIRTSEIPDNKHRYLKVHYRGRLEVPSWVVSDGTLRLLALTILAYIPDVRGTFLIEEPENGIHPRAVETVFQSLSSVYGAQILAATHSPVILASVDVDKVLCFGKNAEGATDIVLGRDHPALRRWRGDTDLGTLFAGGVLDYYADAHARSDSSVG